MDKLIEVEQTDGGWRVLARQDAETLFQVTVVPYEVTARHIADCLEVTTILAANEALRGVLLRLRGA